MKQGRIVVVITLCAAIVAAAYYGLTSPTELASADMPSATVSVKYKTSNSSLYALSGVGGILLEVRSRDWYYEGWLASGDSFDSIEDVAVSVKPHNENELHVIMSYHGDTEVEEFRVFADDGSFSITTLQGE